MKKSFIIGLSLVLVFLCALPTVSFAVPFESNNESVFETMSDYGTVDSLKLTGNMIFTKDHFLGNGESVNLNGYSISNYKLSLGGGTTYIYLGGGKGVVYSEVNASAYTKLELSNVTLENFTTCSTGQYVNDKYTTPTVKLGENTTIKSKSLGLGSYSGENAKAGTQKIEATFYGGTYKGYSDSVRLQIVSVDGIEGGTFEYCNCSGTEISDGDFEYCSIENDISGGTFNNCKTAGKITGGEFIGNVACSEVRFMEEYLLQSRMKNI